MPFEAAKAVAATFAYYIRYALTPLFGKDFVAMCIQPDDPDFESFKIDKKIILSCTAEAKQWRYIDKVEKDIHSPPKINSAPASPADHSSSPGTCDDQLVKRIDIESGYGTDTDSDKDYVMHKIQRKSYRSTCKPQNEELALPKISALSCFVRLPVAGLLRSTLLMEAGINNVGQDEDDKLSETSSAGERAHSSTLGNLSPREIRAAYAMMQLSFADSTLNRYFRDRDQKSYF